MGSGDWPSCLTHWRGFPGIAGVPVTLEHLRAFSGLSVAGLRPGRAERPPSQAGHTGDRLHHRRRGSRLGASWRPVFRSDPNVTVTLLEAGGSDRHPLIHIPAGFARMTKGIASWGWSTVPQRHLKGRVLWYTQARVLGGGSSINAQIYTRGHPADYDAWADEGCGGWSYREVAPYFMRAEDNQRLDDDYHGRGGPLGVSDPVRATSRLRGVVRGRQVRWASLSTPTSTAPGRMGWGTTSSPSATPGAPRPPPPISGGSPAGATSRCASTPGCCACSSKPGRATGVEVAAGGGIETLRADREVIVSCGAIGSPALLLRSGIGPAEHLKRTGVPVVHDLPGVGSNLHDHLNLFTVCECTGDHTYDAYAKAHKAAWAGLRYVLFP